MDTLFVFFDERKTIFEEYEFSTAASRLLLETGITQDSKNPFVFHISLRFFSERGIAEPLYVGGKETSEPDKPLTSIRLAVGPIDEEVIPVYGIHVDFEKLDYEAVEQINMAIYNNEDVVMLRADSVNAKFLSYVDEYLKNVQRLLPYTGYAE